MSIDDATPEEWRRAAYLGRLTAESAAADLTPHDIEALNMVLDEPFGDVPLVARAYVFLLHQTGKVTVRRKDGSCDLPQPTWMALNRYQVRAVEKPKMKPSIDWSQIRPEYKWLARDSDGTAWIYPTKPDRGDDAWDWRDNCTKAGFMASYAPGDCDWQDSLVERPA